MCFSSSPAPAQTQQPVNPAPPSLPAQEGGVTSSTGSDVKAPGLGFSSYRQIVNGTTRTKSSTTSAGSTGGGGTRYDHSGDGSLKGGSGLVM